MDDNDFDFESDYDPQDDSAGASTPPFEMGGSEDAGSNFGSDGFGAELDTSDSMKPRDLGTLEMDDFVADGMETPPAPKKSKKPKRELNWLFYAVIFLIFGTVFGLWYGYYFDPVEWDEARISDLGEDLQEDYVRVVIDSYELTDNKELALYRLYELGFERSAEVLALIAANPQSQNIGKIQQLSAMVSIGVDSGQIPTGADEETGATATGNEPASSGGGLSPLLLACIIGALLLVLVAIVMFLRRRSSAKPSTEIYTSFPDEQEYSSEAPQPNYSMGNETQPVSQWMTTYTIGDDLFDDSFSIDTPAGEFMGECGVGIADTIGVGEPKRVGAFEIWLFDKNDIQTITKVLMSEHAFSDDAINKKLSAKGDPEMALTGHEVVMETATLQMVARVVDMTYGAGSLPDNSFFERMTIELAVWQK